MSLPTIQQHHWRMHNHSFTLIIDEYRKNKNKKTVDNLFFSGASKKIILKK